MSTENLQDIDLQIDNVTGIMTVTINRPERKNAMSTLTFDEIFRVVDQLEKNDTLQAMIITGAKDKNNIDPSKEAFSSGGFLFVFLVHMSLP